MGALGRYRNKTNAWPTAWNMGDEINRVFEQFGNSFGWIAEPGRYAPAMDVRETDEAYIVEADVPGMKKDDIHLEVADNVLTITGERKDEKEEKDKNYHRIERHFGSFVRSVAIPGGIDSNKVSAKFENGVLTVTLPKPEESRPRRIEVKVD
jgi:HSP20 family protein